MKKLNNSSLLYITTRCLVHFSDHPFVGAGHLYLPSPQSLYTKSLIQWHPLVQLLVSKPRKNILKS